MLLRRVIEHVKAQNWTAVALDFAIVVVGVFMGLQVQNWNEARAEKARAQGYLSRLEQDLETDIQTYQDRLAFWRDVSAYGATGLAYVNSGEASSGSQWDILLSFFQASQVAEIWPKDITFQELKSAGELDLIHDEKLREELARYYTFGANPALTERPKYREHVRGVIPVVIQNYIWDECYRSDSAGNQKLVGCEPPVPETEAAQIVSEIVSNKQLIEELRYWMSTLKVASLIASDSAMHANMLRNMIEENRQ